MTVKERATRVLDAMPEERLPDALRLLEDLLGQPYTLDSAPLDNEPLTGDEQAAIAEGHVEWKRGEFILHDAVVARTRA